jgi:uncharacterized membrane protein YeiB
MTHDLQSANSDSRIDLLDILRGIAIFGIIIAHSPG